MNIESVKLIHYPEIKTGWIENGAIVVPRPEIYSFEVTFIDKEVVIVPNEPLNRHYQEVKEWYLSQEQKPFEFDFR